MKKIKSVAATLALASIAPLIIALALVGTVVGTVTIIETITLDQDSIDIELAPNDSQEVEVGVNNIGATSVDVIVTGELISDIGGPILGATITGPPEAITVPPLSSIVAVFTIQTTNGVPVQTGEVQVDVARP